MAVTSAGLDERSEQTGVPRLLGVPLDADHETRGELDGFYDPVFGARCHY